MEGKYLKADSDEKYGRCGHVQEYGEQSIVVGNIYSFTDLENNISHCRVEAASPHEAIFEFEAGVRTRRGGILCVEGFCENLKPVAQKTLRDRINGFQDEIAGLQKKIDWIEEAKKSV